MIRIVRDPEPEDLAAAREAGLVEGRAGAPPGFPAKNKTYQRVKRPLRLAQKSKCAWCEKWTEERFADVEHYRPKATYWWLAWTWTNLLFSCSECNRTWKRDQFPLMRGHPLQSDQAAPGTERPYLLDPTLDDPAEHIQFRLISGRWVPTAREGSRRGYQTIALLGLERDTLLELYAHHVDSLADGIAQIQEALSTRDEGAIQRIWTRVLESRLRANAPFSALTRDVLAHHFPRVLRERWKLAFPT